MRLFIGAFCAALSIAVTASAQSCGGIYKIKGGDTLSGIADSQYKDARKWSAIFNVNREQIGDSPNKIRVGQRLNLPCINGLPTGLEGGVSTAAPKLAPVPVETKQVKVARMPCACRRDLRGIGPAVPTKTS
jgi:polar amino acid transport system substrate-binding protein